MRRQRDGLLLSEAVEIANSQRVALGASAAISAGEGEGAAERRSEITPASQPRAPSTERNDTMDDGETTASRASRLTGRFRGAQTFSPASPPSVRHFDDTKHGWGRILRRYVLFSSRLDPRIDYQAIGLDEQGKRSVESESVAPVHPMPEGKKWSKLFFRQVGFQHGLFTKRFQEARPHVNTRGDVQAWEQHVRWKWAMASLGLWAWKVQTVDGGVQAGRIASTAAAVNEMATPGFGSIPAVAINGYFFQRAARIRHGLARVSRGVVAGAYSASDPLEAQQNEWLINQLLPYATSQKNWQLGRRALALAPIWGTFQSVRGFSNRWYKSRVVGSQGAVRRAMARKFSAVLIGSSNRLAQDIAIAMYGPNRVQVLRASPHDVVTQAIYERLSSSGVGSALSDGRCAQCAVARIFGWTADELGGRTGHPPGADNAFDLIHELDGRPPRMALFSSWSSMQKFVSNTAHSTAFLVTYRWRSKDENGVESTLAHTFNLVHDEGRLDVIDSQNDGDPADDRMFELSPDLDQVPLSLRASLDRAVGIEVIPVTNLRQFGPLSDPRDVILNGEQLVRAGEQQAVMAGFARPGQQRAAEWSDFLSALVAAHGLNEPKSAMALVNHSPWRSRELRRDSTGSGDRWGPDIDDAHLVELANALMNEERSARSGPGEPLSPLFGASTSDTLSAPSSPAGAAVGGPASVPADSRLSQAPPRPLTSAPSGRPSRTAGGAVGLAAPWIKPTKKKRKMSCPG